MKHVIGNMHEQVATWVAAGIPMMDLGAAPYTTIGLIDDRGYLHAGIVYNTYTGGDVVLSIRLLNRKSLTRRFIVEGFRYPFEQLGCNRVTVMIARGNKASQRFVRKLGWKYEGTLREWYTDGQDAIVFGMLKRECRWLSIFRRRTDGSVRRRDTSQQPGSGAGESESGRGRQPAPPAAAAGVHAATGGGRPDAGRGRDTVQPGGLPEAAPGEQPRVAAPGDAAPRRAAPRPRKPRGPVVPDARGHGRDGSSTEPRRRPDA